MMVPINSFFSLLIFFYFWLAVLVAWTLPGWLVVRKLKLLVFQKIVLATVLGLVFFCWQAFVFGYLGLRNLSYFYLLFCFILGIYFFFQEKPLKKIELRVDKLLVFLILTGTFFQTLAVISTGVKLKEGLFFCCGSSPDILWHLSLVKQLVLRFPPYQPGLYGVEVTNYHYWADLAIAELIRLFKMPLFPAFTSFLFFASLFFGLNALVFCQLARLKEGISRWLLFFLYFGGDFAYLTTFFSKGKIDFLLGSLEDATKLLVNPPRALALIVFFTGLSLFWQFLKKRTFGLLFLTSLLFSSLIGFKVYIGIFVLISLVVYSLYELFKKKFSMTTLGLLTLILSLLIYLPVNRQSGTLFFVGFWLFENFIVQPPLKLERFELARQIFAHAGNWLRLIEYELIFMGLFFFTIFGSKLIGLFQTRKTLAWLGKEFHLFFLPAFLVNFILGSFFLQKSGGANTFNFLVNIFILGSFYSAASCYFLQQKIKNKFFRFGFIFLILVLTLPRFIFEEFITVKRIIQKDSFLITNQELEVYDFLNRFADKSKLLVVEPNFKASPHCQYISLFVENKIFLTGWEMMKTHNIDFSKRWQLQEKIFQSFDLPTINQLIKENNLGYFLVRSQSDLKTTNNPALKLIFENPVAKLYQFDEDKTL